MTSFAMPMAGMSASAAMGMQQRGGMPGFEGALYPGAPSSFPPQWPPSIGQPQQLPVSLPAGGPPPQHAQMHHQPLSGPGASWDGGLGFYRNDL